MFSHSRKIKILIVDDTPANLLALHSVLERNDYELVEADSGEAALEVLFHDQDFTLILMDVQMPGMNGFETVKMIKSRPQCATIPVIFLTAISKENKYVTQGYTSGTIDYVTKPYNPDQLQAKVSACVKIYRANKALSHEIEKSISRKQQLSLAPKVFEHAVEGIMITDTLGHATGDELLKGVARRLLICKRDNDLVARQGGDEFTGVMVDLKHPEDAAIVAKRMLIELAAPITLGSETVHISASIGLSIFPDDGANVEVLTRNADAAMYHAKETGRNNYQFYTASMHQEAMRRIELDNKCVMPFSIKSLNSTLSRKSTPKMRIP